MHDPAVLRHPLRREIRLVIPVGSPVVIPVKQLPGAPGLRRFVEGQLADVGLRIPHLMNGPGMQLFIHKAVISQTYIRPRPALYATWSEPVIFR